MYNEMNRICRIFTVIVLVILFSLSAVGTAQEGLWAPEADIPTPTTSVGNGLICAIGGVGRIETSIG